MKLPQKKPQKYNCDLCDFHSDNKRDYSRHIDTMRHIRLTNPNEITQKTPKKPQNPTVNFTCTCGKTYKHKSTLCAHKLTCDSLNSNYEKNETENSVVEYKGMFLMLMNENKDLRNMVLDQQEQYNNDRREQRELLKELIPKIGNTTNYNKFDLNMYLNETCKDAMNIMDFVNSLNIELNEVENFGSSGYVEGISKIFIRGLKELEATKRPIHCSDLKRETLYVKYNNTWEKENAERSRIKEAINKIANKNVRRISDWTKENPTSLSDYNSKKHSQYMYILNKSMGACDPEENNKDYNKIIRKIASQVIIER
jgi:hypothetical protein